MPYEASGQIQDSSSFCIWMYGDYPFCRPHKWTLWITSSFSRLQFENLLLGKKKKKKGLKPMKMYLFVFLLSMQVYHVWQARNLPLSMWLQNGDHSAGSIFLSQCSKNCDGRVITSIQGTTILLFPQCGLCLVVHLQDWVGVF